MMKTKYRTAGPSFVISILSICVAFPQSSNADEAPKTISCIYSSHMQMTSDHTAKISGSFGIWRIDSKALIRAPGTQYEFSVPVLKDDPDYLIASNAPTADGSFDLVVLNKKEMALTETSVGATGEVLINRKGDCRPRPYPPLPPEF